MAETTTTRFSLRRWSAGTDTPQRAEFDTNFANIETLAAIDKQGAFGSRPAAGVQGTYYWDTTNEFLWRDNGSAWKLPSSKGQDATFKGSTTGSVPLTVDSLTGQTANLFELKVNAVTQASVSAAGSFTGNIFSGKSAALVNDVNGNVVLSAKGSGGQTANLFELKNSANTNQFVVSNTGVIQSSYLRANTTSTLNAASSSNVASMAYWSGTPMFEVRSNVAGTGAFNEFAYLKRDAVGGDAVSRRFGMLMKVGNEDASGATRSAAMYLYSTAANMDTPTFRIDVRDVTIWDMNPTAGSITTQPVWANGSYLRSTPAGTGAFRASNTWVGTQNSGDTMYFRAGSSSNGFYWYGGGAHSDTSGDPGVGGQMYAVMSPTGGGSGKLTLGKIQLTEVADVFLGQTQPTFMVGLANAGNVIIDDNEIAGRNNGSWGELLIQHEGGSVSLGGNDTRVEICGNGVGIGDPPVGPLQIGDIWFDFSAGSAGVKRWSGSSWITFA